MLCGSTDVTFPIYSQLYFKFKVGVREVTN